MGLIGIVYFAAFLGFVVDGIRDMLLEMKSGKMYVPVVRPCTSFNTWWLNASSSLPTN